MKPVRPMIGVIAAMCLASGAYGAASSTKMARDASQSLRDASAKLIAAESADDRIAALTQTIRAFEAGLLAMRDGLRNAAIRERVIKLEFENRRDQISQLLGVLLTLERATTPLLLIHPEGAVGTARSGMMVSEVTPGLQQEAENLRVQLAELEEIRSMQQIAEEDLQLSLAGVQEARVKLSQAISQREELPKRFSEDPIRIQILADNSATLDFFADALTQIPFDELDEQPIPFEELRGKLAFPTTGTLLRKFNETDAAGLKRPGILLATSSLALVSAPVSATIRYAGPFLDYANVIILEPDAGYLIVLAGMSQAYGAVGEVVEKGDPVGLLGGKEAKLGDFLVDASQGSGTLGQETLYIEVRENGNPTNPLDWFGLEQN
ncbi:murein hydrolase activator EnvC family protein [Paramylibacter kogurei]|nr:peptidoglycan DD-metalloendopeptidase family protein [Amylibacter kogurei]